LLISSTQKNKNEGKFIFIGAFAVNVVIIIIHIMSSLGSVPVGVDSPQVVI